MDVKETFFVVDGRRVPSEWDGVRGELRWRPLVRPPSGSHRYQVIAADKAGNARRASGTFVLD